MAAIDTIISLINNNVDNYPNKAFQNNTMRTILLLMCNILPGGSGGGAIIGVFELTSANFTTATNCPIPALNGLNILVFMNDIPRYLLKGTDWQDLAGGGFTILMPGFDATANNYSFYVSLKGN